MKSLFLSIFLFIASIVQAQTTTFKAEAINIRTYNDSIKQFDEWTGWYPSNVIITVSDEKVHIYSTYEQIFFVIGEIRKKTFEDIKIVEFDVLDKNESRCTIEILHRPTGKLQIYVRWTNLQLAYEIKKI